MIGDCFVEMMIESLEWRPFCSQNHSDSNKFEACHDGVKKFGPYSDSANSSAKDPRTCGQYHSLLYLECEAIS